MSLSRVDRGETELVAGIGDRGLQVDVAAFGDDETALARDADVVEPDLGTGPQPIPTSIDANSILASERKGDDTIVPIFLLNAIHDDLDCVLTPLH
jgi:hypothetical protein